MKQDLRVKLSIIIVSFNTRDITDACINSIYNADWKDSYEIIVVDNNSHDGSCEMIKTKYPKVKLIENKENKLFSIANNQGAKVTCGKYLLLLNSDTLVDSNNLQRMIDYFDTLPNDVICIGPKILNKDGSLQSCGYLRWGNIWHHCVSLYNLNRIFPLSKFSKYFERNPDISHPAGWVSGCCMMIPRDKYIEVGGLNENLIFYGEEPEFGFRTYKKGYKTLYYAGASIIHLGGQSTNKKYSFEKDIAEYDTLVQATVGSRKAIQITQATVMSLRIKLLFYKNKDYIRFRIKHEKKVTAFFRNKLKQS